MRNFWTEFSLRSCARYGRHHRCSLRSQRRHAPSAACHSQRDESKPPTNESPQPAAEIVLISQPKSFRMNGTFGNVYEDEERARAYATLQFPGTYYLAFRDLPALIRRYNHGSRALDFGCGTGRSTRFLRNLGLDVIGADISQAMLDQARALDTSGDYYLFQDSIAGEFASGSFDIILAAFTFDNIPT